MKKEKASEGQQINPAKVAAKKALDEMFECIRENQNFRLEAGAGAGKTYSLIEALKFIIGEQGNTLLRNNQQIACITYTNVATGEIISRIDGHSVVRASTIHSFCWEMISKFQPNLRKRISEIDAWSEKLEEVGGVGTRKVKYDIGHRIINETTLFLHHDDVLKLMVALMELSKFRTLLTARFPIILIDEYQDTNEDFAKSILRHFIAPRTGPLIGLFGDSWQKIYGDGIGLIDHVNLKYIGKEANFRSVQRVVNVLNKIRPDLPQFVEDSIQIGTAIVYHTNEWTGQRRGGSHWKSDLPTDIAHKCLESLRQILSDEGWVFTPDKTKILMLTHNLLATEQNYARIAGTFRYNDSYRTYAGNIEIEG